MAMSRMAKIATVFAVVIPLLTLSVNVAIWLDTRYMHKEISDTRFLDTRISMAEGHIRDFEREIRSGRNLTIGELRDYDFEKDRLKKLKEKRDELLGVGDQ